MTPRSNDWHGVALAKLRRVMGESAGDAMAATVLAEIGIPAVTSARELRQFAAALTQRGGFAGAVGALLELHATMYESQSPAI